MRDPKRINRMLKKIKKLWKTYPDMRLTQLIMNALAMNEDPYYIEDELLERKIDELSEVLKQTKK